MAKENYSAGIYCPNCGEYNNIMVTSGVKVKDHIRLVNIPCLNCDFRLNHPYKHKGL